MVRPILVALLLALATAAFAQPVITGVSPASGPTAGGTVVTITGTGFLAGEYSGVPFPPEVYFGELRSRSETLVNGTTIVATTPAHLSGAVTVRVKQVSGIATMDDAFRYVGSDAEAVTRFLIPVFLPPIPGAFGSEFRSELWVWNPTRWMATMNGLYEQAPPCPSCPEDPLTVPAGTSVRPVPIGNPGTFFDVTNDVAEAIALNLRVYDTSRASTNFGTEIPIVPFSAFRERVLLPGVPVDSRYRLRLRVYGDIEGSVRITFGTVQQSVNLSFPAGRTAFSPSYADVALVDPTMPPGTSTNVTIETSSGSVTSPALKKVWAFITVTNNDSQHITTITPQPSR